MIGVAAEGPLIGRCRQSALINILCGVVWFRILLVYIVAAADVHVVPLCIGQSLCKLKRTVPCGSVFNRYISRYCCGVCACLRQGDEAVVQ